jgi:hypothetical protein
VTEAHARDVYLVAAFINNGEGPFREGLFLAISKALSLHELVEFLTKGRRPIKLIVIVLCR